MNNILITGGTGFVGSHMIDYILKHETDVKIFVTKRWMEDTKNVDHIDDKRFEFGGQGLGYRVDGASSTQNRRRWSLQSPTDPSQAIHDVPRTHRGGGSKDIRLASASYRALQCRF